jgi:hypothetical protein
MPGRGKMPIANSRPIIVESNGPLSLPPVCVCCGSPARHACAIKPSDPSKFKQELALEAVGLFIHPVSWLRQIDMLRTKNALFPMCRKCRFSYFFPSKLSALFIVLVILCLADAFYAGFHKHFRLMLIDLVAVVVFMILAVKRNVPHSLQALPIRVFLHEGKYRYEVYGGPIYDLLERTKDAPPSPLPPSLKR